MVSEKEAELIGMHVGDGTLYKTSKTLVWELRGSTDGKEYYNYISKLLHELFSVLFNPKFRSPNAWGIQTSNKQITTFFTRHGFEPGTKVYTVRIPDYIKKSNKKIKLAFIRGLFDTDGCLRFEKNRHKNYYYPRIEFSFASKLLIDDLCSLLISLGFKVYRWDDRNCFKLGLAGVSNLRKWLKDVSTHNPKHFKKKNTLKGYAGMAQWYGADNLPRHKKAN